ncbi:hypothetical protein Tco_0964136 [Tanacetum coccineum]
MENGEITLAHLKDQPAKPGANASALQPTSSYSVASSGVRYVASKILGNSGNGSRVRGFVRGNGNGTKSNGGTGEN